MHLSSMPAPAPCYSCTVAVRTTSSEGGFRLRVSLRGDNHIEMIESGGRLQVTLQVVPIVNSRSAGPLLRLAAAAARVHGRAATGAP